MDIKKAQLLLEEAQRLQASLYETLNSLEDELGFDINDDAIFAWEDETIESLLARDCLNRGLHYYTSDGWSDLSA